MVGMLKPTTIVNPKKAYKVLNCVWHAPRYSIAGLRASWQETAFRQQAFALVIFLPAAFWLGRNWVEAGLLAGTVNLIMIVELLNTSIETAIDRVGPKWHDLSKPAKNIDSVSVLCRVCRCALEPGPWLFFKD